MKYLEKIFLDLAINDFFSRLILNNPIKIVIVILVKCWLKYYDLPIMFQKKRTFKTHESTCYINKVNKVYWKMLLVKKKTLQYLIEFFYEQAG